MVRKCYRDRHDTHRGSSHRAGLGPVAGGGECRFTVGAGRRRLVCWICCCGMVGTAMSSCRVCDRCGRRRGRRRWLGRCRVVRCIVGSRGIGSGGRRVLAQRLGCAASSLAVWLCGWSCRPARVRGCGRGSGRCRGPLCWRSRQWSRRGRRARFQGMGGAGNPPRGVLLIPPGGCSRLPLHAPARPAAPCLGPPFHTLPAAPCPARTARGLAAVGAHPPPLVGGGVHAAAAVTVRTPRSRSRSRCGRLRGCRGRWWGRGRSR